MILATLIAVALALLITWAAPRPTDYTPGRPLNQLQDIVDELQRIATMTRNRVTFRGVFTTATVYQMSPPPEIGDWWLCQDLATGAVNAYVQLSLAPRLRATWTVTLEAA